mgnify:CR=1 FL=1
MNIAIVGATGLVGREIINLCEEFLPKDTIYTLFASSKSAGKKLKVNGKDYEVKELAEDNIESYHISLFSAGGERSKNFAEIFTSKGSYVIDNSSAFRMEKEVPLVVFGINENTISQETKLISNPNCTTMGLVMALKPLHDKYNLLNIVPVAYQAVSGSGSEAVSSLIEEESLGEKLDSDYEKGFLTTQKICELVSEFDGPVFLDSKKRVLPSQGCLIKINETEKGLLTGDYNNLIVTKGSGGADYDGVNYPAEKTKVYDVVGAGDTFLSALVYFYLICGTIEKAIPYANRAAAIAVQNFGTYVLTENDVKDLCD